MTTTTWNFTTTELQSCKPIQEALPDIVDQELIQWVFGFCYALIWIFGVVGNLTVLYMVILKKINFTVRTVFIASLACSDLLMGFTSLPITAITTFTRVWVFMDFLCYVIGFLQASSVFVSSFTLITIAVDRYYLIFYPHSVKITYDTAKVAVGMFWCFAASFAIPMSAFARVDNLSNVGICGSVCVEHWPSEAAWLQRLYGALVSLLQYGLPLILCSYLYVQISYRIRRQYCVRLSSQQSVSVEMTERSVIRRRRTNRMMAAMVVSFVLAWLPINLLNLIRDFDLVDKILQRDHFTITYAFAHLAAMSSMIWNPIIYSWFNYKFRKAVKNFLRAQSTYERSTTTLL